MKTCAELLKPILVRFENCKICVASFRSRKTAPTYPYSAGLEIGRPSVQKTRHGLSTAVNHEFEMGLSTAELVVASGGTAEPLRPQLREGVIVDREAQLPALAVLRERIVQDFAHEGIAERAADLVAQALFGKVRVRFG